MQEQQTNTWKTFVARQPILDKRKNIFAYELLSRCSLDNFFPSDKPDNTSSSVLVSSLFLTNLRSITGGHRAFINFTQNLLTENYASFLPPDIAVVEILENVVADNNVIEACKSLKQKGYLIALDDVPIDGRMAFLLPHADIVKVDWLKTPPERCRQLAKELRPKGIELLATKVETHEHFRQALAMGCSYFQGFFFCEPEVLTGRDIPVLQSNCMLLLREANKEEPNLSAIERILMQEPSLCYKLLRYLNSAIFYFYGNITSVRHALSLLGMEAVRRWVSLVTLAGMGEKKPEALVVASIVRAKFCESIGRGCGQGRNSTELFLMGLFSLIDAILDRSMEELLATLPISNQIKEALVGKQSEYQSIYELARAYERSEWDQVSHIAQSYRLTEEKIAEAYVEAVGWAQELTRASKAYQIAPR